MQLSSKFAYLALLALFARSVSVSSTFKTTKIFTSSLRVGVPSTPITSLGGTLINEPITNGSITGPIANGTIHGGFAHPKQYNNTTVATIDLYGITDDEHAFYIHVTGVGGKSAQVALVDIAIGGTKYAELAGGFILATLNPSADRTTATVEAYLVQNAFDSVSGSTGPSIE